MFGIPWQYLVDATIVLIAAFAWFKGDLPERIGGALNLGAAVLALGVHLIVGTYALSTLLLVVDGLLALGFLGLALVYASLWVGGALMLQGAQFSLHAYYIVTHRSFDRTYAMVNNGVSYGILLCILLGTLGAWWHRTHATAE